MSAEAAKNIIPNQAQASPMEAITEVEPLLAESAIPKVTGDYPQNVLKYMNCADVCTPCLDRRKSVFERAQFIWWVRYPDVAETIAALEQKIPCDHAPDNNDILQAISKLAAGHETNVELVNV